MIMVLVIVATMIPAVAVSAETDGGYTYTVKNGEATITDFNDSYEGDLVIPDTLGGYPVVALVTMHSAVVTHLQALQYPKE